MNTLIVWKDGTHKVVEKNSAWEFENDENWLVSLEQNQGSLIDKLKNMKYENFKKAKSIVEQIDKTKEILKSINSQNVFVRVLDGEWTIVTIGSWSSCEHEFRDYAARLVNDLKLHHEKMLRNLYSELELL